MPCDYITGDPYTMVKTGNSRTGYRTNSILMLLLILLLSAVLAWASSRLDEPFDWTRNNRHSLSDTSISILEKMSGPVLVTAYAREQRELRKAIRDFIAVYQRKKPDIELDFKNPDAVPGEVRALGISVNGELVLQYRGRREPVRNADESTFANALLRLSRDQESWIVFLEGHGERNPLGKANHDLGQWAAYLRNRGYHIQPLNLAEGGVIPGNTSVLVLAGPQVPLLPAEMERLLEYIRDGGNLLWLADPETSSLLKPVADSLNLTVTAGIIIDVAGRLIGIDDPTVTMITDSLYGDHQALAGFHYTTLFPGATALFSLNHGDWSTTPLLTTGDHTWLKTETPDREDTDQFNEDTDLQGPLVIGMALERQLGEPPEDPGGLRQKIIAVGDGDFLSNTFIDNAGNLELGVRMIDWLSDTEEHISIPPRVAADRNLEMSLLTLGAIGIFFLFLLPALLAITGLVMWRQRRNR